MNHSPLLWISFLALYYVLLFISAFLAVCWEKFIGFLDRVIKPTLSSKTKILFAYVKNSWVNKEIEKLILMIGNSWLANKIRKLIAAIESSWLGKTVKKTIATIDRYFAKQQLVGAFFWSKKWFMWAYGGGAILLGTLYYQVQLMVQFNDWNKEFFDMVGEALKHNVIEFWTSLGVFTIIAVKFILVASLNNYITRQYAIRWREAITFYYAPSWYHVKIKIEGASQRIQEDAKIFASIVENLGQQAVSSVMTLVAFLPILWVLSKGVDLATIIGGVPDQFARSIMVFAIFFLLFLPVFYLFFWSLYQEIEWKDNDKIGYAWRFLLISLIIFWLEPGLILLPVIFLIYKTLHQGLGRFRNSSKRSLWTALIFLALMPPIWIASDRIGIKWLHGIPGSLVWVALMTSVGGMIASWLVGIKLPGLAYNNQVVEAEFRKQMVFAEDHEARYALFPTPEIFHKVMTQLFGGIRFNYNLLYLHYGYFDLWSNLYQQIMIVAPYILMGPGLFPPAAIITAGTLMQVGNTFGQVNSSASVFIQNWTQITELRSVCKRLHEFRATINKHAAQK